MHEPRDERTSLEDEDEESSMLDTRSPSPLRSTSHSETTDVEKHSLLGGGSKSDTVKRSWKNIWSTRIPLIVTVLNLILFLTSLLVFWLAHAVRVKEVQDHWRATSFYSPVFDRFNIAKLTKTTNGTFWNTSPPSIWRERTGPAADAAWDAIGSNIAPITITSAEVIALGKNPAVAVRAPPELGLGNDAYIAGMDVFHHLHCLDKLRREISYAHYHEATEGPRPGSELHAAHIDHCVDMLAQALRCSASVDMVTFEWVEGHRMPQPNFSNQKVCRDFDALRDWTVKNGVDSKRFFEAADKPPFGAVIVPEMKPGKEKEKEGG